MPAAKLVDNQDASIEHVLHDIPTTAFQGVQEIWPMPVNAVQVRDVVGPANELFVMPDLSNPVPNGLGAMSLAGAVLAKDQQQATSFRRAPHVPACGRNAVLKRL